MQRRISLIPQPQQLTAADGDLDLSTLDAIAADPELHPLAWLLSDLLNRGTGLRLTVTRPSEGRVLRLRLDSASNGADRPADLTTAAEAYRLDVTPDGVDLAAAHPAGIARGIATLRQLLPADALREAPAATPVVPHVSITDEPRLRWRGVMLDVARHFQPKDFVLKMIDRAWLHRLNVVHLHLTDDQGWRFEIPSRPKIADVASWRTETKIGHARDEASGYEPTPHGGFFSVSDLREIASYARERHVLIVPEVNLPGHARAVLAAYPELGAGEGKPVSPTFGVFEEVLEPTPEALDFALEAYTAVAEVFEGPFVHIGGDEVPMTQWETSPVARELMEREGIEDVRGVQAWFTKAFCDRLTAMGKRVIGWDEILDGGAPAEAVVHVWRNEAYIKKAVAAGHQVVASPEPYAYYDHYESDDPEEPLRIHGLTTVDKVAGWDPVPPGVDPEQVLGIQCQLWSEYLPTPRDVEYSAFPRLSVLAEVGWTNLDVREANPVRDRLPDHLERLHAMGIDYRPLTGPERWQRGGTGRRARYDWTFEEHQPE
jgi:hexosaminidase